MRSINTSIISVIPILALIVVAVWLLGVGTLKDLALVQLIGILVGTYSSIFFATPLLVALRERTEKVRSHNRRVIKRREQAAAAADGDSQSTGNATEAVSAVAGPAPGAKPARPSRPSGKRER